MLFTGPNNPQIAPFHWASAPSSNAWFNWAHRSLHPQRHLHRFSRFCTAHSSVPLLYNGPLRFLPQIAPFPWGRVLHLARGIGSTRVMIPNGISMASAIFVWVPNAMLQCIVNDEEKPSKLTFPLGFRHPAGGGLTDGDRQEVQTIR